MNKVENVLKSTVQAILPEGAYQAGKRWVLTREARRLRERCDAVPAIDAKVDLVLLSERFHLSQVRSEIVALLEELRRRAPRRMCEIGGRCGGSLALFAQVGAPDARLLSVDLDYRPGQTEGLAGLARPAQSITCFAADSHTSETLARVRTWLSGDLLDFLFIDGDHSYEGVKADFEMYAPLVRAGGCIAFHDIVPDAMMRTGVASGSYVGGVPVYWQELKARLPVVEFVHDWSQDGYGIGFLEYAGHADSSTRDRGAAS